MPYIKQYQRELLSELGAKPVSPGELNYCITMLLKGYLSTHGENYNSINDILGALEGVKLEFYNRIAAPYELKKRVENGDVF